MKIFVFAVLAGVAVGQTVQPAVIKPSLSTSTGGFITRSPRTNRGPVVVTGMNYPLRRLIEDAFRLKSYEIEGPDWLQSRFDISQKIPEGATEDDFKQFLRTLLSRRFKLRFHREDKEVQGFELVVMQGGHKMKEHVESTVKEESRAPQVFPKDKEGFPIVPTVGAGILTGSLGTGLMTSWNVDTTMANLVAQISSNLDVPVEDSTGLIGRYDYLLRFIAPGDWPTKKPEYEYRNAVENQLGLKLQPKKLAVNMLIVDHIEKLPTEN